jgi:monoterpene epsilon-lactone hydrolase
MRDTVDALWQRRAARASNPPRTLDQARVAFAPAGHLVPLPNDVLVTAVDAYGVPAYWLDVPGAGRAVLLYVHGGGYSLGSLHSHGPLAAALGRATRRRVLFCEYRLAPEHRFPAAVEDVATVWRWLGTADVDPASVVAAGDSAGGGLVLGLLHAVRDAGGPLPAGAVLMSPYLDQTASGTSIQERADQDPIFTPDAIRRIAHTYLGSGEATDPAASPLFASHTGLPPLLIQVGTAELLLSDAERLADAATAAGVEVTLQAGDGLPHVYQGALDTPESARALREIAAFDQRISFAA